jgi:hypothetical protein
MPREVTHVEPLGSYRLALTFCGGERRKVDIAQIVSFSGIFAPRHDKAVFRQVPATDLGTVNWPNGADFCPDVLYARSRGPELAA